MGVGLEFARHGLKEELIATIEKEFIRYAIDGLLYLPDEASLLEVKLELLRWVQIVEDHETARGLVMGNITEVDALGGEGCHRAVIVEVGTAHGQVFVELNLDRSLLLKMVARATKTEGVWLDRGTLNITNLDGKVESVLFRLKWAE